MAKEKKSRTVATVMSNKSGCNITNGVMRLIGNRDSYHFSLESMVNVENATNNLVSVVKMVFNLNDMFKRADEFGIADKLGNKLRVKFNKYPNLQISGETNNSFISFMYENVEFVTSTKTAIKYQKEVGKIIRTLNSVGAYLEKLVLSKTERMRKAAEKKANKKAAAREAAEAIPNAVEASEVVTG